MARRRKHVATGDSATGDSYDNFNARVGTQANNQHAGSTYRPNYTSRNRLVIEWAYRSSWIIGAAVDAIPDDMTKKGVRITSEMDPERVKRLMSMLDEYQIWDRLNETLKWSRLYGGAVNFIMIDGQNPKYPLDMRKIGKGSFKGLLTLDRWMINPQLTRRIKDLCPDLGKPEFYDIVTTAQGIPPWTVHYSRLLRFDGVKLPYQQALTENEWGMSIVERIFDRLTIYDSTAVGAGQLAYKAHLRVVKVKELRKLIALGGKPLEALYKHFEMVRSMQTNEGLTLLDDQDSFEAHQYAFGGLADLIAEFKEEISAATGIPLVRLFGQSPKGFSTGDTDLVNYYDRVDAQQDRKLRPVLRMIFDVMHRSEFGEPLPDDFDFVFNPLWQMSDVDRSTVAMNTVNAISTAVNGLGMSLKAALTDLRNSSQVTGIGASITDEDINDADNEPPPPPTTSSQLEKPERPSGDPVSNQSTQDSARGGGPGKWRIRWFK